MAKKPTPAQQALTEELMTHADDLREQLNAVLEAEVAKIVASIEAFKNGAVK